jgi:hypothetical protein
MRGKVTKNLEPIPDDVRKQVRELASRYPTAKDAFSALGVSATVYHDLMTPGGVLRKDVLQRVSQKLVLLLASALTVAWSVTLLTIALTVSCASKSASFASDIAPCELAPTCAEAVKCRLDVAKKYNRDPSTVGHCEPLDGGNDGSR